MIDTIHRTDARNSLPSPTAGCNMVSSPSTKSTNRIDITLGVFTNRAILSYNGPYNGLGNNQRWSQGRLTNMLEEGAIRGNYSLGVMQQHLENREWLALDRPSIADLSVFVYVALAPMGDISLEPYPAVLTWIEKVKKLPGFFAIEGLDDPMVRRRK